MYYAKVFKEDLGRGLEILSDILMNSLIDASAVHRERDVILREMEEVNKQQEEVRCACACACASASAPHRVWSAGLSLLEAAVCPPCCARNRGGGAREGRK